MLLISLIVLIFRIDAAFLDDLCFFDAGNLGGGINSSSVTAFILRFRGAFLFDMVISIFSLIRLRDPSLMDLKEKTNSLIS